MDLSRKLTDEQVAAIKRRVAGFNTPLTRDVRALLTDRAKQVEDIARLRTNQTYLLAEIERLRPIVEAVAKWGVGGGLPVEFYHQAKEIVEGRA